MSTKYRVVFYPWIRDEPYALERLDSDGEWAPTARYFRHLGEVDNFIEDAKKGQHVAREFELP